MPRAKSGEGVLALDLGTSSVRAVAYREDGAPEPGDAHLPYTSHDADELVDHRRRDERLDVHAVRNGEHHCLTAQRIQDARDGRIDDAKAGWKGRGLWTTSGDRTPWLMEGGKGKKPIAVHFQLRPDPLAH